MNEFIFKDGLKLGIRESDDNERNTERLTTCYNAKPCKYGLLQHTPINFPVALESAISGASETISHPFPQIFRGIDETLLFSETKVYGVNESSWAISPKTITDLAGGAATIGSGGGSWQFADFNQSWWAFNGVTTAFVAEGSSNVRVDTSVPTQTGCHFKGRAMFGGFDSSNFWSSAWQTNIANWTDTYISNPSGISIDGIGSNFVSWSSIGGGDVLAMLYPDLMTAGPEEYLSGGHGSSNPIWLDYLRRNECGFLPMDWGGTVICLKQLGDLVVAYGDNGISALFPANDPYPTFGLKPVAKFGIAHRTAVGGDESRHIFIDTSGTAWALTPDLKLQKLDYSNTFSQFVGDDITIVHDPQQDEYHVTGTHTTEGRKVYTLTETGIYRHKHAPTSAYFLSGGMVGVYEELSNFDTLDVRTDTIDFGNRDVKTIQSVQVSSTVTSGLSCRIYYRLDSGSGWNTTQRLSLSDKGILDILVSGVEFQIQIYADDYTDFDRIDYLKILWRESGVRNFRGTRN